MRIPNNPQEVERDNNIESLLGENLKINQEILKRVKKIERFIFWQRFWGWFKFALILIPIILAAIYLPGYIKKAYELYNQILSPFASQAQGGLGPLERMNKLIEQLKDFSNQIDKVNLKNINFEQFKK